MRKQRLYKHRVNRMYLRALRQTKGAGEPCLSSHGVPGHSLTKQISFLSGLSGSDKGWTSPSTINTQEMGYCFQALD